MYNDDLFMESIWIDRDARIAHTERVRETDNSVTDIQSQIALHTRIGIQSNLGSIVVLKIMDIALVQLLKLEVNEWRENRLLYNNLQ